MRVCARACVRVRVRVYACVCVCLCVNMGAPCRIAACETARMRQCTTLLLYVRGRWCERARHAGVKNARTAWVLCIDVDLEPSDGLSATLDAFGARFPLGCPLRAMDRANLARVEPSDGRLVGEARCTPPARLRRSECARAGLRSAAREMRRVGFLVDGSAHVLSIGQC